MDSFLLIVLVGTSGAILRAANLVAGTRPFVRTPYGIS